MKPIFSLCIPTRTRVASIERLLGTLLDTTTNKDRIEILFKIDDDDIISESYLRRCRKRFPCNIRVFKGPQSDFLNRDYYNFLAEESSGDFSWVIGDDLLFIEKDWDTYLINKINEFLAVHKTKVVYVNIKDDIPPPPGAPNYANFPLISNEAIKMLGFFMPPEIPSWTGDYLIYLIYSNPKIDKVLTIDKMIFNHVGLTSDVIFDPNEISSRQRWLYTKYSVKARARVYEERTLPRIVDKFREKILASRSRDNEPISLL